MNKNYYIGAYVVFDFLFCPYSCIFCSCSKKLTIGTSFKILRTSTVFVNNSMMMKKQVVLLPFQFSHKMLQSDLDKMQQFFHLPCCCFNSESQNPSSGSVVTEKLLYTSRYIIKLARRTKEPFDDVISNVQMTYLANFI